jgi:hypothetical protein
MWASLQLTLRLLAASPCRECAYRPNVLPSGRDRLGLLRGSGAACPSIVCSWHGRRHARPCLCDRDRRRGMAADGSTGGENIAVQRVRAGSWMSGLSTPSLRLSSTTVLVVPRRRRKSPLVQLGQGARTGFKGEQADALATVASVSTKGACAVSSPSAGRAPLGLSRSST